MCTDYPIHSNHQSQDWSGTIDLRMTTVANNIQRQMDTMNQSLMDLQQSILRLAGVPEEDLPCTQCPMVTNIQDAPYSVLNMSS